MVSEMAVVAVVALEGKGTLPVTVFEVNLTSRSMETRFLSCQ
jgi:hypothetical protein